MNKTFFMITLLASLLTCFNLQAQGTLTTVDKVEIDAYLGKWYEIARLPNKYQRKCKQSTAEYTLINETTLSVVNTCYKMGGKVSTIKGQAKITNAPVNSKLSIQFKGWFSKLLPKGKYWILDLEKNKAGYEISMVGTPDRKNLWILSRSPVASRKVMARLKAKAKDLGFATENLIDTL